MYDRPSSAAILVLGYGPDELVNHLDSALTKKRYRPFRDVLPRGYRPADGEWLAFAVTRSDDLRLGVIVPEDISAVFRVALWLSVVLGEQPLMGWRCYRGLPPVMKLYAAGRPLYKEGEDPDLEVDWPIPTTPPYDVVTAADVGLPRDAHAVVEVVGTALRPFEEQAAHLGDHQRLVAWAHRTSPLLT